MDQSINIMEKRHKLNKGPKVTGANLKSGTISYESPNSKMGGTNFGSWQVTGKPKLPG